MNRKNENKKSVLERLAYPFRRFVSRRQKLTRRERKNQNYLIAFCLVSTIILCSLCTRIVHGVYLMDDLKVKGQKLQTEQVALTKQTGELKRDVKLLKDDDYVLKLARQRFLLSKEGELVFVVTDDKDDDVLASNSIDSNNNIEDTNSSALNN